MKLELLAKLDPNHFTVEEIAALFGWWRWFARIILNTGVRQGEFSFHDGFYRLEVR